MSVIDDFQQVAAALVGQWRQAPVIDDQYVGLGQLRQGLGMAAIVAPQRQHREQTRQADVKRAVSLPAGLIHQGTSEEGLANPNRAANQDVLVGSHPNASHQTREQGPAESAGMTEIDIFRVGSRQALCVQHTDHAGQTELLQALVGRKVEQCHFLSGQ
jgi:hypothetical protein